MIRKCFINKLLNLMEAVSVKLVIIKLITTMFVKNVHLDAYHVPLPLVIVILMLVTQLSFLLLTVMSVADALIAISY